MEAKISWGNLEADIQTDWIEALLLGGGLAIGVGFITLLSMAF